MQKMTQIHVRICFDHKPSQLQINFGLLSSNPKRKKAKMRSFCYRAILPVSAGFFKSFRMSNQYYYAIQTYSQLKEIKEIIYNVLNQIQFPYLSVNNVEQIIRQTIFSLSQFNFVSFSFKRGYIAANHGVAKSSIAANLAFNSSFLELAFLNSSD